MLRANSEKLWKPGNLHRFITGGSVGGAPSSDLPSAGSEERGGGGGGDELVRGTCHPAALHDGGSGSGSVVVLPSFGNTTHPSLSPVKGRTTEGKEIIHQAAALVSSHT